MEISRRLTVAAAVGAVLLTVMVGCAKTAKGPQGSLGQITATPSTGALASASPIPLAGPSTLPTVRITGGRGTPSTPSTAKSTATHARAVPGTSQSTTAAPPPPATLNNDYSIVATGNCSWSILYDAGNNDLMVGAEFTVSYVGKSNPTSVPFTFTANVGGYHTDGNVSLGTALERTGGVPYSTSPYLGQQVTVTGTLLVTDDYAANNAASITVSMPTLDQVQAAGLSTTTIHPVSCS